MCHPSRVVIAGRRDPPTQLFLRSRWHIQVPITAAERLIIARCHGTLKLPMCVFRKNAHRKKPGRNHSSTERNKRSAPTRSQQQASLAIPVNPRNSAQTAARDFRENRDCDTFLDNYFPDCFEKQAHFMASFSETQKAPVGIRLPGQIVI